MSNVDFEIPPLRGPALRPVAPVGLPREVETNLIALPQGDRRRHRLYRRHGKRLLDVALVLVLAPLCLPLIGLAALALYLEGGNPFYLQERLGRGGARFPILKLRTMVRDAEARLRVLLAENPELRREWDETQKLKRDPRITPVGEFLRTTSLDELPQLWNVLLGQMSLVGPRPMMPEQLPIYGDPQHYFALRPGITGAWQVGHRNQSSFATRHPYDAEYHRGLSLWRDLKILCKTIVVVLRRTGH